MRKEKVASTRPKRATANAAAAPPTTTAIVDITPAPTKKFNIEKRDNDGTTVDESKDESYKFGSISAIVSPTMSTTAISGAASVHKKTKRGIMSSLASTESIKFTSTVKQSSRTRETIKSDQMPPPVSNLFSDISSLNANDVAAHTVVDSPIVINNKKIFKREQSPYQYTKEATTTPPYRRDDCTPKIESKLVNMIENNKSKMTTDSETHQEPNNEYKTDLDLIEELISFKKPPPASSTFIQPSPLAPQSKESKAVLMTKSSSQASKKSDKANKENKDDDDSPSPVKKSKSSIKISKLDKVEQKTVAVDNKSEHISSNRSSKRKLPNAKSIDYKETSPEPIKVKERIVIATNTNKNKKRKMKEENNEQIEEKAASSSLKLYEEEEVEKSCSEENEDVEAKKTTDKKVTTKKITRQRNTAKFAQKKDFDNASPAAETDDAYEFKAEKPRKQPSKKPPPKNKKLTAKQLREQEKLKREEKEMAERAKEYEELKNYKLIVEKVDHDY